MSLKKRVVALVIFIVIIVILIGILIYIENSRGELYSPAEENSVLPKVGTFEKFKELIKDDSRYNYGIMEDAVMESAASAGTEKSTSDYSKTNVQTEGVDEADIIKTDGRYIYYVTTSKIVIVDAKNPNDLKIVKEIKYDNNNKEYFNPAEVYIKDNTLVVIGNSNNITKAICYDITNKENISIKREVAIEGNYLSSRMIDNNIYLVSNKYINYYRIYNDENVTEEEVKPMYKDTAVSDEYSKIGFDSIYYCPGSEDNSYMLVAGFNIENEKEANVETYLGAGNTIYSSKENLYIVHTKYIYDESLFDRAKEMIGIMPNYDMITEIYKFNLDSSNINFVVKGEVKGAVLNQFSMDENNGYFRIAVTEGNTWSENNPSKNHVYVLDGNLNIVGKLEDLAKGERIYSARFMGNKLYMVTFVQTDPLFVIDLSNPSNPTVLGELKIPGYSNYLHPYDETHIIGFGEDTETITDYYGTRTITTGMKMALFDVSDVNDPKEMYMVKIGDRYTYSEILNNHKALLFSKEKNIIAFPITIYKEDNTAFERAYYNDYTTFQGAIVYGLDLENGFSEKGRITHRKSENNNDYAFQYESQVDRIIYIGDTLFTTSKGLIKATNLNTYEEIGSVKIEVEQDYYYPIMPLDIIEE